MICSVRGLAILLATAYGSLTIVTAAGVLVAGVFQCYGGCGEDAESPAWYGVAVPVLGLACAVAGLLAVGLAFAGARPGLIALGAHAGLVVAAGVLVSEFFRVDEVVLWGMLVLGAGGALNYVLRRHARSISP